MTEICSAVDFYARHPISAEIILAKLNDARGVLLAMAGTYPNAIIPAYTWGVQAQPITLGHYMLGYAAAFARTGERMRQAYARINLSPLGAAA